MTEKTKSTEPVATFQVKCPKCGHNGTLQFSRSQLKKYIKHIDREERKRKKE